MSDLISRQKVLDAIQQRADRVDSVYSAFWEGLIIAQDIVKNVPSAEPERKKGEWIDGKPYVNSHWRVCSVCHESAPESSGGYHFCPNCGAEMRGE